MNIYTEFDQKKVVAILKQLEQRVNNEKKYGGYYFLKVSEYDNQECNDVCFNSTGDLINEKAFEDPSKFCMVHAEFFMGINHSNGPVFTFSMGENKCNVELVGDLFGNDDSVFEKIFPVDVVSLDNWRYVVPLFMERVKHVILNNIHLENEIS